MSAYKQLLNARQMLQEWRRRLKRDADMALWRNLLQGKVQIGEGTRIDGMSVFANYPSGCSLIIGSQSDIHCGISFWRSDVQIRIGSGTHIGWGTRIDAEKNVCIGDEVLIAWGVMIMDTDFHPIAFKYRKGVTRRVLRGEPGSPDHVAAAPIHIADKVWIGAGTTILKGVHIGEGAIVGAASVVTQDVPAWTIVAGNPARTIRELDPDERDE